MSVDVLAYLYKGNIISYSDVITKDQQNDTSIIL